MGIIKDARTLKDRVVKEDCIRADQKFLKRHRHVMLQTW